MMKTPDELKARELGTSSFAAGVIQPVEDLRTQYNSLSQLYQQDAITNSTRKNQLYTAMGLAPYQQLPTGIQIPRGFEIEYKLVQHENDVRFKFDQYLDGQMGYDTFLYEAYGRDILKTQGHDLKNPMYWYSQRQKGITQSPIDNPVILKSLLNQAEDLFKLEEFFQKLAMPIADTTLAGELISVNTMADLFSDQEELADQLGGWEKVLTNFKAGTLSGFDPLLDANGDGEPDYYLHTSGKLYALTEDEEIARSSSYAKIVRKANGEIDRISISGNDVGDWFQELWTGFVGGVTSIVDLGGLVFAAGESLVTGTDYGDAYNNYLAWRNAWAPESNVYQVSTGGFDDIAFGFASAAGTIAGFLALTLATAGLGSVGKAGAVTGKAAAAGAAAKSASLVAKIGTGAKKAVVATTRTLINLNSGIPFGGTKIGITNVLHRAAINFTVEGAEAFANAKARQAQTGLTDEDIILRTIGMATVNASLTVLLNGGTDDMGALTRLAGLKSRATNVEEIGKGLVGTAFGRYLLKHPKQLFVGNVIADTLENAATMAIRTTFYRTGGKMTGQDVVDGIFNPQALFSLGFMTLMGAKGFMGNEGMRTYGAMRSAQDVNATYIKVRDTFEVRYREANSDPTRGAEARALEAIIQKMDADYARKTKAAEGQDAGEGKSETVAQIEILDEIHNKNLDGLKDRAGIDTSFVTKIYEEVGDINLKQERLKMERMVTYLFEQRVKMKKQTYSEILNATATPKFLDKIFNKIPIMGSKRDYKVYDNMFTKRSATIQIQQAMSRLGSNFVEDLNSVPGGEAGREAERIVLERTEANRQQTEKFIRPLDPINEALEQELKNPGSQQQVLPQLQRYYLNLVKFYADQGRTNPEELAQETLARGAFVHIKMHETSPLSSGEDQKQLDSLLNAYKLLAETGQDKDFPHIIKVDGSNNEAVYIITGDLDFNQVKRQVFANKFVAAVQLIRQSQNQDELDAAIKLITAAKLQVDEKDIPAEQIAKTLKELYDNGILKEKELADYIFNSPMMRQFYTTNEAMYINEGYVKYARALETVIRINTYRNLLDKVGAQKNIVKDFGDIIKEFERYDMLETLIADGRLTQNQGQVIADLMKKNFPELLSYLKNEEDLLKSSLKDGETRNADQVIEYLIKRFGKDKSIELISNLEKEIMGETSEADRLLLGEMRQRLGESEFQNLVDRLVNDGIIETNEINRAGTIDDLFDALTGRLSKTEINKLKRQFASSRKSPLQLFVEKMDDNADLFDALSQLGYFKKNKNGIYVRTLKEVSYEELISELKLSDDIKVQKFLDIIDNVVITRTQAEIFELAFKKQLPGVEVSDLKESESYLGQLLLTIGMNDNKDQSDNVRAYDNIFYDNRIKFYEWLLQDDHLEKFLAIDNEKIIDGERVDLYEFRELVPEELRDYINLYAQRNRIITVSRGSQEAYNANPLEFSRKMFEDVLKITLEQKKNKKGFDSSQWNEDADSIEAEYSVTPKQIYEDSIRESKGLPTTREEVLEIVQNENTADLILNVMYNRLNSDTISILQPQRVMDALITYYKEHEDLIGNFKTKGLVEKKKIIKERIQSLLKNNLPDKVIMDALDSYFRDSEGTGSFYEYTELKQIKTQTAVELENFYKKYVEFVFDDTDSIEVEDTLIQINLQDIKPEAIKRIEEALSYQNKSHATQKDMKDIQTNANISDYELTKQLLDTNRLLKYYNGSSPIIQFNLKTETESLNQFLQYLGYSLKDLTRNNFEGVVGINAVKPGSRGFKIDGKMIVPDALKIIEPKLAENMDIARQLFVTFHNIVWMKDDTVINPQEILGNYVFVGEDLELLTGYVNMMIDESLGKLGKAGSKQDGATLSQAFAGLNIKGEVDPNLKNFMMVEWLYNTLEKYLGKNNITGILPEEIIDIDVETAQRIQRHGWLLEKTEDGYIIKGYKKPDKIEIKAGEKILLNEILPSKFELKPTQVAGILTKLTEVFDETQTTLFKPSDFAFLKQDYDGQNEILELVSNRQFDLVFSKDLNNEELKLKNNMTVLETKAYLLTKPNSARAIMLLNKLNAATRISDEIERQLIEVAPTNVDIIKVAKLMQNRTFIDKFVKRLELKGGRAWSEEDVKDLNFNISLLRPAEPGTGEIKYSANRGFSSARLSDMNVMTGEEFRLLNPRVDYTGMSLTPEEARYIESRLKSVFTNYNPENNFVMKAESSVRSTLASFVYQDSKGQYHLGVGAAEYFFMYDYDEQLRQILGESSPTYIKLNKKIKLLREMYPNAVNKIKVTEITQDKTGSTDPSLNLASYKEISSDPEFDKKQLMAQEDNRRRSDDIYNARNKYIKASQSQRKISNEYNGLFKNMLNFQSDLISTKVSDPSRSMVLNMKNQLATGEMIKGIDDIAMTIRERGIIKPFNKQISNDAIYDLATEIYMLSSQNFRQSEYAKYLIVRTDDVGIKKVQDINGEMIDDPEGRQEVTKFYASYMKNGDEESLIDLYATLRELDPEKNYAVFVLDRSDYLYGKADINEGATLRVINFKDFDQASSSSKGYQMFRSMAIEALKIGKEVANKDLKTTGSAQEYIRLALSSKQSKLRLMNKYKENLAANTSLTEEQRNGLFYSFTDTDVTMPFRNLNEEALFRTLFQTAEQKLYDKDSNNYTKRVKGIVRTGINIDDYNEADEFRLSLFKNYIEHKHKDYVDGLIRGDKVNLKLSDTPEDIESLANIFYDYMVRGDDLEAIKFIINSSVNPDVSLREYASRRIALVKDAEVNNIKLTDIEDYNKVYLDIETIVPNRNSDKESKPFQIGLIHEANGRIIDTKEININIFEYQKLIADPEYSDFKRFIDGKERLSNKLKYANKVSESDAVNEILDFIDKASSYDNGKNKPNALVLAHNGKDSDFKWLGEMFNRSGKIQDYLNIQPNFMDTYDILLKFPILGFNDKNAMETIKHNIDALSEISFLSNGIEELKQDPRFKIENRDHDAKDDAGLLSVIGRHMFNKNNFLSMDVFHTNLLKTFEDITKDLGMNLSNERFFEIINNISDKFKFNIEESDFTRKVNSTKELTDLEFKNIVDNLNDYMLTMDNLYSRKNVYGKYSKVLSETQPLREVLRNKGNLKLDKIMSYIFENFKDAPRLTDNLTEQDELALYKVLTNIFNSTRSIYGDFNRESGKGTVNAKMLDRIIIQALTDGEQGLPKLITTLNESIGSNFIKKPFSVEDLESYNLEGISLSKALENIESNPESYINKIITDEVIRNSGNALVNVIKKIDNDIFANNKMMDLKSGDYRNLVLRNLFTVLNDNIDIINRDGYDELNTLKRLNTEEFRSKNIEMIRDMIKEGIPLHQLSMKRYWGLVTAFTKQNGTYDLINKDGQVEKINKLDAGTIVISKKIFESMFGMDETKYRSNLKLNQTDDLYLTMIRYPADQIDPLFGYKVKVDYSDGEFIRMNGADIHRHSGDFDGDKVVLVKPTIESQEYYSKGMLDFMNKPYQIIEDLKDAAADESFFNKSKEKYLARVELSNYLQDKIIKDYVDLKQGTNYDRLLQERIDDAKNLFTDPSISKLLKDAGYEPDTIKDLVKDAWIEKVDLGYLELGKEEFLINNAYYDTDIGVKKLRKAQQDIGFPIINFKDSVTGYVQKLYSSKVGKEFYQLNQPFSVDKLQYRNVRMASFVKEALRIQIESGNTNTLKDVLRNGLDADVYELFDLDNLDIHKIQSALILQEAKIRTSKEFEQALIEGAKVKINDKEIRTRNQELIDMFNDMTRGSLDDAWINYGSSYNNLIPKVFDNILRDNPETRTEVISIDKMLELVNKQDKYIILDPKRKEEKGTAILRKEYAEANPTYRTFSFEKNELPDEYKNYTKRKDFMGEENGRLYFSQRENLSSNIKFASIGNDTLFKSTVARVIDNDILSPKIDNTLIDSADIAMYVSYDSFDKIPSSLNGELVKIKALDYDGNEVEYDAIKTNLAVVENRNADPSFVKIKNLDMLVFSHSKNTALEPVMFGDVHLKYDVDNDMMMIDQKLTYDMVNLRETINEPLLLSNDASGLYYNLILNSTYSLILNNKNIGKNLPTQERNKIREELAINQTEASYKNQNILNKVLVLVDKYYGDKYFDDELTPVQRFHKDLTPTQKRLFGFDLYKKIHPTITTSVKSYEALESKLNSTGPESLIVSKRSKLPMLEEKGEGLRESFGYATSDMLLDTSQGFISQPGYISKLDFLNYFSDKPITKNDILTLYKEGLLERGTGRSGKQETGFLPSNVEDLKYRNALEDPKGAGWKSGAGNTNPGVSVLFNTGSYDFSTQKDFSLNDYRSTGETFLPKQSRAISVYDKLKKQKSETIYRSNYATLIKRLSTSMKDYDNEYDRAIDYDISQPKNVVLYKNPKQLVFDDDGNIELKYSYAPKFEGTVGQAMKFMNDKSLTSHGYNVRNASNPNERISNFENEVFRSLDFAKEEEVNSEFISKAMEIVSVNHKQEILEQEINNTSTKVNTMYRAVHEPISANLIKMKKDLLATSGIGGTEAYDVKLNHAVTRLGRDQKYIYADLMSAVPLIKSLIKNPKDAVDFNNYMKMKQFNWLLLETEKDSAQQETVLITMKQELGIDNKSSLEKMIKQYSNVHFKEAALANMFVTRVVEMGETVAKETDQVSPKIFQILRPIRNVNPLENKQQYVHTLKTLFNFGTDIKAETIDKYLPNTSFNFFHSMDVIVDSISKLKAAKNLSNNLKEVGALDNATFINQSNNIFEDEFSKMIEDPSKNVMRRHLFDHVEGMLGNKFVIDKNSETSLYKLYTTIKKEIAEMSSGQNLSYKNIDELRKYAEDTGDVTAKDLIIYEELLEDIKYEAVIENPEIQKRIIERVRSIAELNDAKLVNEYGQLFPTSNVDGLFKPIGNFDTSFLINNLKFIQSGETYEQRLALAAVTGRLYMMDRTTADHLNNNFYTRKVPSRLGKLLSDISSQSTKFIMSSLPQLANRMFNFSMFDYGIMATVDPGYVTKIPRALREFSALMQSNGKVLDSKGYDELNQFIKSVGFDPTKMAGLDIVQFQEKVKTPKFLNGYFNFTDKALQAQTLATRYALFLHVKESFDKGKGVYGSAYFKKDGIDALPDSATKAMMVVDETLGSPGAFPFAAKYTQGWAMFATFPLALIRYGVNNTRTIGRVMKDIYMGEVDNGGIKQLAKSAVGLTGVALLSNLLVTLVSDMYGVDEETEEEWKKDQVLFKPLQTLLFGRPYVQYGQSANPLQSLEEMFVEPFTAKDNDTLIKKLTGLVNTNILGKLNPVFKVPAEILTNKDFFGPTPITTSYSWEDNLARKLSGYIIGIGGANAMVDQWRYSKVDLEDPTFVDRLGASMKAALVGEIGNNKGYKAELKNYYNAMSIINGYRAMENKELYGDSLNASSFDSETSFKLASDIRKAMNSEQRPSVIYGLINDSIENGAGKNEILYALRSNSIMGRLSQIRNANDFYASLSEKEKIILDDAVLHENKNYSILKELLQETSQSNYSNRYARNYVPRIYPSYPRDPRYIYNPRYFPPRTPFKPKRQAAQLQRRNMFVPRLSDATGSRAPGITGKLKVQTSPQSFVGLMGGMAIRKPYQNRIARSLRPRVRAQETPKVFDHRKVFKE